jgi:S1-C subfamily serine protease
MRTPFRLAASLFLIVAIATGAVAATPIPNADKVRDTINRFVRVQNIVRRIAAANVATCPAKRGDFGFTSVSPNPDASAAVRAAWTAGLGLGDSSTVVAVYGSGPAEAAGLRVGDNIVSADGVPWSPAPERRKAFAEALDGRSGEKHLMVKRATTDVMI